MSIEVLTRFPGVAQDNFYPTTRTETWDIEDQSPFGLQGLMREQIRILKPECITRLAIMLALRGSAEQIRDASFVDRILSYDKSWVDEYQVVHLIEKSLWIQGHSDLVMTMTRNPSQIPDNPPRRILNALSRANSLHPESTIWYGVPLFSEEKNSDGLPIPVTADQVRSEAARRIGAAQQHALNWGWAYRAAVGLLRIPAWCGHRLRLVRAFVQRMNWSVAQYNRRIRMDARRRARAELQAQREYFRFGCSMTPIPDHTTWVGQGLEHGSWLLEYQASLAAYLAPLIGAGAAPALVATVAPLFFFPITLLTIDPFLFVELPGEPGKLRHVGHWYWQEQDAGRAKLHVHT